MLDVESKFVGHLFDNLYVNSGVVLLVVDGEQRYAPLMLSDDSVGGDDAGTASLAAALRGDGHSNLADAGTKLSTLKRVLLKTANKSLVIFCQAAIAFG